MRRKSERTSGKKSKISPEKKIEKVKRTKTRRKKQSTSSDNDSPDEVESPREEVAIDNEKKPPSTPVKEDSPEEAQDQVWRVKAAETGDSGEIQKLKICLTRPPSTPERAERSPRSKRKHSRATSSSDAASVDAGEERKRSKHRSKRAHRDSKDELDKNQDSHEEEQEAENEPQQSIDAQENENEVTQSENDQPQNTEATISTTNEENQSNESGESNEASEEATKETEFKSDADTTVASPKSEAAGSPQHETPLADNVDQSGTKDKLVDHDDSTTEEKDKSKEKQDSLVGKLDHSISEQDSSVIQDVVTEEQGDFNKKDNSNEMQEDTVEKIDNSTNKEDTSEEKQDNSIEKCDKTNESQPDTSVQDALIHDQSESLDKSEILELHPEESRIEMSDLESSKHADSEGKEVLRGDQETQVKVSISRETGVSNDQEAEKDEKVKDNNESGVVENENDEKELRKPLADSEHDKDTEKSEVHREPLEIERQNSGGSDTVTTPTAQENIPLNGQAPTTVVSRKRRWGSRPKITTQKSITISTEVLKEIIPDVKPVAFDEVIEEKKHRRVEVTEKVQRPLLPKIVIDNTENVEQNRKEIDAENKDKESTKSKEHHLASNRKISIVKDNDNKLARPPSPPKHKQSSILYITNLVRPFTLPQLKNLLQRTGKIMENGFWIDRIKSKCFVQYETEDQAVETRHALHGVKWPVSNPKTLHVDFSTQDAFDKAKTNEDADNAQVSTIPGTVEDWLREQDQKRERVDMEKPWDRKASMREWDVGKNEKDKEREKVRREERPMEKRRHRSQERSPEPARKFKKKEEEAPAKLLDDLFRKTKTTPCIYWLPLSVETIAIKEEQRRQHMAEYERRMQEQRRPHRRH